MTKIVVAGDVSVDWLSVPVEQSTYLSVPGTHRLAMPGGALLLASMIEDAAPGHDVKGPERNGFEQRGPNEVINTLAEVGRFEVSRDKSETVYRISQVGRPVVPTTGKPAGVRVTDDDADAEIVVLDDAGHGFRDDDRLWPATLNRSKPMPIVVLKSSRNLAEGKLWGLLSKKDNNEPEFDQLVVVVSADDLREKGLNISRRLSWERTVEELLWQIGADDPPLGLPTYPHLVVRFGLDGALYCRTSNDTVDAYLEYDPAAAEDAFWGQHDGDMIGLGSAFVAGLVAGIAGAHGSSDIDAGIRAGIKGGIAASRALLKLGYGDDPLKLAYASGTSLPEEATRQEEAISGVKVPTDRLRAAWEDSWTILNVQHPNGLEELASRVVVEGGKKALKDVPVGVFGKLQTVDRLEIESLRTVGNLMREYYDTPTASRPLSIAVFGPPGAGKSFGVSEVATSIAGDDVKVLTFNLSQVTSGRGLVTAFHQVRDEGLRGKLPLVFFDEFDCDFEGELGRLKYFLSPMHDGTFLDGGHVHPIGRAILVFAGGTCHTFKQFSRETSILHDSSDGQKMASQKADAQRAAARWEAFVRAKGPDFVSRLRGYVDVNGPNPRDRRDDVAIVRRALVLRHQLREKAPHIFDAGDEVSTDKGVLRAFLRVPEYKHATRSITAILEMSMLKGRTRFEPAALPPPDQLDLHVDSDTFSRLVLQDGLVDPEREIIARAIHEHYRAFQDRLPRSERRPNYDPAMQPWDDLPWHLKLSNFGQADDIPRKLKAIDCGIASEDERRQPFEFQGDEVEKLARMEHERWIEERKRRGWLAGERDPSKRQTPDFVTWDELVAKGGASYKLNLETARMIPEHLARAGLQIYRI